MPSTCDFEFDRPTPIYFSGETINGRIILNTISEKSVKEVYILFKGEAKVRWTERKSRRRNGKTEHYTVHYRGDETYLHSRTRVHPAGALPTGTHTYNFSIPIPFACPTACVEEYGRISYAISLVISRNFRFDNVFNQPLTVLQQLDLNLNPEYLLPVQEEDTKYFCCWPCSSGPVLSTLTIPFSGFAPGQKINYTLHIDNQSNGYDLQGIKLKLVQTYEFTAHSPSHKTRNHSNTLAKTARPERCLRFTKRIVEGSLLIPPVPPSSVQLNSIIKVRYHIEMTIQTGDCHSDSEMIIPIVIGTVPLAQSATDPSRREALFPTAPQESDSPDMSSDLPPSYDLLKPPSFEEATSPSGQFIDTDVDVRNRIDGFIPRYPMYTNFATPTAPSMTAGSVEDASTQLQTECSSDPPPYTIVNAMPVANMPPPTNTNDGYGWNA